MVETLETKKTNPEQLAELMVGRRVLLRVEKGPANPGDVFLSVENLVVKDDLGVTRVKDVSFSVRAGEIVGIAGVAGNGQSELLESVSGMRDQSSGNVRLKGTPLSLEGDDGAAPRPRRRARARARGSPAHGPRDGLPGMGERHPRLRGRARNTARASSSTSAPPRPTPSEQHQEVRHPPGQRPAQDRQLLRRQPAEDRSRPRDGARSRRADRRPADARRRHRRHRVHPQPDHQDARRGQGDPARLGRARRNPLALATASS